MATTRTVLHWLMMVFTSWCMKLQMDGKLNLAELGMVILSFGVLKTRLLENGNAKPTEHEPPR